MFYGVRSATLRIPNTNARRVEHQGKLVSCTQASSDGYVSSCSLSCFKQHKSVCAEQQTEQSPIPQPKAASHHGENGSEADTKPPVLEVADLKDLFRRYPGLQSQLREIYKSTRDPSEALQSGNGRDFSRRAWNPEKGFENGLKVLGRLEQDKGASSEGIAAFMKLLAERSTA